MNWRIASAVAVGLVLVIPWVLLSRGLIPGRQRITSGDLNVSPMLSSQERLNRVTYLRHCSRSDECDAPLGCLTYPFLEKHFCTDSQCETDSQCKQGRTCQLLRTEGSGPWVRMCRAIGVRKEGEGCDGLLAQRPPEACEQGLTCSSGFCGRPCRLGEPAGCPEGFFCAQDAHSQPTCLPTCAGRSCPAGQSCIQHTSNASTCAVVSGTNCQEAACPPGQACDVRTRPGRPGEVLMTCEQLCGEQHPACPEGHRCYGGRCWRSCDPRQPNSCGAAAECIPGSQGNPGMCLATW